MLLKNDLLLQMLARTCSIQLQDMTTKSEICRGQGATYHDQVRWKVEHGDDCGNSHDSRVSVGEICQHRHILVLDGFSLHQLGELQAGFVLDLLATEREDVVVL